MLVMLIVTFPAFALSVLVLYSSWPLGFAERLTALEPEAGALPVVVDVVVAGVVAGAASLVVVVEELLLPQPARATRAISAGSANRRPVPRCVLGGLGGLVLTICPPVSGMSLSTTPGTARSFPRTRASRAMLRPGKAACEPAVSIRTAWEPAQEQEPAWVSWVCSPVALWQTR